MLKSFYNLYHLRQLKVALSVLWVVINLLALYQLRTLKVDFNFESFFQENSIDKTFYDQHKQVFGYDNDYLLLIIKAEKGLFNPQLLRKIAVWEKEASSIEGIESINSPLSLKQLYKTPFGLTPYPLIHINDSAKLASDSVRIINHPLYRRYFSFEQASLLIALQHHHFTDSKAETQFYNQLQQSIKSANLNNYSLVGRLSAQKSFIENIGSDFATFTLLALLISAIILWLIYRSFRLMLIPYLISVSSLIISLGIVASLHIPLSILSILLPTIILFVSTSDAIHLTNSFRQAKFSIRQSGRLYMAVKKVFAPTFLTSITTAIGFLSLYFMPSQPIRELGILAAMAIMIAFLITFIFGPLLLTSKQRGKLIQLPVRQYICWLFRNQRKIIITISLLSLLAFVGVLRLKSDAYLLRDLPEGDEVRSSFELVDKHFGGSKPWEMAVWPTDTVTDVWDPYFLTELNKIHRFIQDSLKYKNPISLIELVQFAHQTNNGGYVNAYKFPPQATALEKDLATAKRLSGILNQQVLMDSSEHYSRILAFIPDWGARLTQQKNKALENFISENVNKAILSYQLTGTTYLIDKSNEMVSYYLIQGLFIAALLVSIILMFYFKSVKMLLISLVPNLIPLFFTAGIMGFMDIPIKLTTTIIFVVAFGIAVDDTIHFIGAFQEVKSKHSIWRVIQTMRRTAFSIIVTTLIITAGFSLFTFSSFATAYYLGLFLSIALLWALLCDLMLLPLLLNSKKD